MRFQYVVLLTVAILLAIAEVASASKNTRHHFRTTDSSPTGDQFAVLVKRQLRTDNTATQDDEERAMNLKSIPGLEKLTSGFKSKITSIRLKAWSKKQKTPDYIFTKINLNQAGGKLFKNPNINVWADYTRMVSKNPDYVMLTILKAQYKNDEKALATMFIAGKASGVEKTKALAADLQRTQIKSWLDAKKDIREVFNLLSVKGTSATSKNRVLWRDYIQKYNAKYVNVA